MTEEISELIFLSLSFLFLFALAEILYHKAGWPAEYSRKLVHTGSGLLTMLFPLKLESLLSVGFLCGSFLLILQLSKRFRLLPSINAIDRNSVGSIAFPAAVFICFLVYKSEGKLIYYYPPLLIMAICDPLAALVGKARPFKRYRVGSEYKSFGGSAAFIIPAFMISFFFMQGFGYQGYPIACSIIVAAGSTTSEALSRKGWDNLMIPLAVLFLLYILENQLAWISLK